MPKRGMKSRVPSPEPYGGFVENAQEAPIAEVLGRSSALGKLI